MLSVPVASLSSIAVPASQSVSIRPRTRVVLIVSTDSSLRERLSRTLTGLRWQVLEAPGGAEAWLVSQTTPQLEALLVDPWLPDLTVAEFLKEFHAERPQVDLLVTDGTAVPGSVRGSHHQELLYAIRRSQDGDTAAWRTAPSLDEGTILVETRPEPKSEPIPSPAQSADRRVQLSAYLPASAVSEIASEEVMPVEICGRVSSTLQNNPPDFSSGILTITNPRKGMQNVERIPELIGSSAPMLEVSRRIRLVASRSTPVLIEGPTGSGKELVAEALHRLSNRNRMPFVAINCAAIPEALLEAELFGHTRGAFTGAVQGRTGRIESAHGGTLFLDEIGELPLALQSKLLRFFESGELQRIGDNETIKVDVRIVAATHQPLAENAQKGQFRLDLYYRLAVFLIRTPALVEHMEDLPHLVDHFLERLGRKSPVKRIDSAAMTMLKNHSWPGNVRELEHVLERASILAGDEPLISIDEVDFGLVPVN